MDWLPEVLVRHWGLEQAVVVRELHAAWGRWTLVVETGGGRCVAKVFKKDVALGLVHPSATEVNQRLAVFDYLAARAFPQAPRLIRTSAGEAHVQDGGYVLYVMEWIDGAAPPRTSATYEALGAMAARLNSYRDFPHPYPISVDATIDELRRGHGAEELGALYWELVDALPVLVDQPNGLIHGEINPANVLSSHRRLYLLDWDAAGSGPISLDPGYPLITHFLREDLTFDDKGAGAFYRGYTSGEAMTDEQRELVFSAAILHALRHVRFGDQRSRWQRLRFAHEYKEELLAVMPSRI